MYTSRALTDTQSHNAQVKKEALVLWQQRNSQTTYLVKTSLWRQITSLYCLCSEQASGQSSALDTSISAVVIMILLCNESCPREAALHSRHTLETFLSLPVFLRKQMPRHVTWNVLSVLLLLLYQLLQTNQPNTTQLKQQTLFVNKSYNFVVRDGQNNNLIQNSYILIREPNISSQ